MDVFNVSFLMFIQFLVVFANEYEKVGYKGDTTNNIEEQIDNDEQVGTAEYLTGLLTGHFFIGRVIDTKWCGPGNVARSIYDLGGNSEVDTCCKNHDLCEDSISPGESKYGLTNNRIFTSVSCDCDENFRYCLENIGSLTSSAVIVAYSATFPQCFALRYKVRCILNNGKRCLIYVSRRISKADDEAEYREHYHWLDSPFHSEEAAQYVPGTLTFTSTLSTMETTSPTTSVSENGGSKLDSRFVQHPQPLQRYKTGSIEIKNDIFEQSSNHIDDQHQVKMIQYQHLPQYETQLKHQSQAQYELQPSYERQAQYDPQQWYPPNRQPQQWYQPNREPQQWYPYCCQTESVFINRY